MFEEVIAYLRQEKPELKFKAWQCVTALVLPNSAEKSVSLENHLFITGPDLKAKKHIFPKWKFTFKNMEEYTILASTMLACVHSASIVDVNGIPELCQIASDVEETQSQLAGIDAKPDGPGYDGEKLLKDLKKLGPSNYNYLNNKKNKRSARIMEPANSYPSWLFWNPDQAKIICSEEKRLIIHGTFGTGKSQVSKALLNKFLLHIGFIIFSFFLHKTIVVGHSKQLLCLYFSYFDAFCHGGCDQKFGNPCAFCVKHLSILNN